MPAWSNDDNFADKPMIPFTRQVRKVATLTVGVTAVSGSNTITFTGANSAVNCGIAAGMFVYDAASNVADHGDGTNVDFFTSTNSVASVSGNVVTLVSNTTGNVAVGTTIDFAKPIVQQAYPATQYANDTVLITASRTTHGNNSIAPVGNMNAGWNHIVKKTNNDGTVRFLKETLVALASPTAANTSSANTSFGNIATGL